MYLIDHGPLGPGARSLFIQQDSVGPGVLQWTLTHCHAAE